VNKWRGRAIGLTMNRLVVVAWPEMVPASGGGEAAAVWLPRLEIQRGEEQCRAISDGWSSSLVQG
jgi:hypothetical protein